MKKSFTRRPFALMAMVSLFYGCQKEDLSEAQPIKIGSQTAAVVAENCDVLDFENAALFPRDDNGFITGALSQKGANIKVSGYARYSDAPATAWLTNNRANIFNTSNLPYDHPDADLETPNWNNTTPSLGNILIVQELLAPHNVASDPNDNSHGGKMELDFSEVGPVTVNSMDVVDIENHYELRSRVDFFDGAGNKINSQDFFIAPTGNNGVAKVTFPETKGVVKMVILLDGAWNATTNAGSGGIDNIAFCKDSPSPPTPPTSCGPCEGKVNSLTLKYNGADNTRLVASVKTGAFWTPLTVIEDLDAGETFTLQGALNADKRHGFATTLGTEVLLVASVNGQLTTTRIHTSCSQPIYQSYENGLYLTLAGSSKIGGPLCGFASPEAEEEARPKKEKGAPWWGRSRNKK